MCTNDFYVTQLIFPHSMPRAPRIHQMNDPSPIQVDYDAVLDGETQKFYGMFCLLPLFMNFQKKVIIFR
jgi:hypothetical protein